MCTWTWMQKFMVVCMYVRTYTVYTVCTLIFMGFYMFAVFTVFADRETSTKVLATEI